MVLFSVTHSHVAAAQDLAPVLRGRALEIVDDHERVRAEIKVFPAQRGTTKYPEAALLRLNDSQNGADVKLETTEDGAGLVLGGKTGTNAYTQLSSRGTNPLIKIVNKDGREQIIKP